MKCSQRPARPSPTVAIGGDVARVFAILLSVYAFVGAGAGCAVKRCDSDGVVAEAAVFIATDGDVDALSGCTTVSGNLIIAAQPFYVGPLDTHPAPTTLDGLEDLESVAGILSISSPALTSVTGLSGLTSAGVIAIRDNDVLASLDGLSALATVGGAVDADGVLVQPVFAILNNQSLTSIEALTALTSVEPTTGWAIADNPRLPQCQADALAARLGADCGSCYGNDEAAVCR